MALDHVSPGEVANLHSFGTQDDDFTSNALIKTDDFEAILMHLRPGKSLPEHAVDGPITVQCLAGRIDFAANGASHPMGPGDWLHLAPGARHAVKAIEESRVLVTILFPKLESHANRVV